jgi:RCC1 and BTB domain-containing protein
MAFACGGEGSAFVVENGAVYAFGRGDFGQLGLGSRQHQRLPARVCGAELHGDSPVVIVAAGAFHRAALTEDGAIWTCGSGSDGQLGHGDAQDRLLPMRLGPEAFGGLLVLFVACGWRHTMALTGGWRVWTCGDNDYGQLGHGDRTCKHLFTLVARDPGPFGGACIVMAAAGSAHSVVVSAEGDVFTWGRGVLGRLGHNDEQDRLAPAKLGKERFGGGKIVFVAAGGFHTVALEEGGVLWVWGSGDYRQLGMGGTDNLLVPTRVVEAEVFGGSLVRTVACGDFHTLVVTEDGVVWTFGDGEHGCLGLNDEDDRQVPTRVDPQRFEGAQVATVAAGDHRSAAVTEGGALFIWGRCGKEYDAGYAQMSGGLGHAHSMLYPADLANMLVPTPMSPRLLGGARVGRWHGLAEELALAFAMGTHARLGAGAGGAEGEACDKGCLYLMMPADLAERVVEACRWSGEGKLGDGVKRLMGWGRRRGGP